MTVKAEEGMVVKGTVQKVLNFGAFVDAGLGQDGLIHVSKLSDDFVKHPKDVLSVGDEVNVEIINVDEEQGRIGLKLMQN